MSAALRWLLAWFQEKIEFLRSTWHKSLAPARKRPRANRAFARFMREYEAQNKAEETSGKR